MKAKENRHGGLTLVPLIGFRDVALRIKGHIETMSLDSGPAPEPDTPVDVADFTFGSHIQGEPRVELFKRHIGGHDVVIITSGPGTPQMLVELIMALRNIAGQNPDRVSVMSGYFPLSRSDKTERDSHGRKKNFSAASLFLGQFIHAAQGQLNRFFCFDLHAEQIEGMADAGLVNQFYFGRLILEKVLGDIDPKEPICIIFPDDGSRKRFELAISKADVVKRDVPMVLMPKRRQNSYDSKMLDQPSGDLDALKGAIAIGFDDELASGGTSITVARCVKEKYGARAYREAVTHGVFCGNAPQMLSDPNCPIDRLYCSDTIPLDNRPELQGLISSKRIIVVPSDKEAAQICFYNHWDRDIWEQR